MPREDPIVPALWAWAKHSVFFPHMMLPHEVLAIIMSWNQHSKQNVFDRAGLSASARKHVEKTVPLLEWIPTPASLLGCGQMVAPSNGTEANVSLLLQ